MVVQLIAKAVAGSARAAKSMKTVKPKRTRAGNVRSEAKQVSDALRNQRRRYDNAAKRADRQAERATDEGERLAYRMQAQEYRDKSESLRASNIAKGLKRGSAEYRQALADAAGMAERPSLEVTVEGHNNRANRNRLAGAILQGNVASQFCASTVTLWQGTASPKKRLEAIVNGLGASDLLDAIEKMEEITGRSYRDEPESEIGGPEDKYDKLQVRRAMLSVVQFTR